MVTLEEQQSYTSQLGESVNTTVSHAMHYFTGDQGNIQLCKADRELSHITYSTAVTAVKGACHTFKTKKVYAYLGEPLYIDFPSFWCLYCVY